MSEPTFVVGDVVTRDGTDRQVVRVADDGWGVIDVECIVAPSEGWCAVGERETNLTRRYSLVRRDQQ